MDGFIFERLIQPARRPRKALCAFSRHRMPLIVRQKAERIPLYCQERTLREHSAGPYLFYRAIREHVERAEN
jgi:hypothetical protein